ncbi:hypothetical protein [Brachyspira sp.]|uniref:hypothetical protein n=1 Tax=Brachyspira sp. TaxID=1977261 RepID=UPI003D7C6816
MELEGTWGRQYWWYANIDLSIDNNGNITLFCHYDYLNSRTEYTYIGKIDNNFEYPYTVKITQTSFYRDGNLLTDSYYGHTGTITFDNASSCSVVFDAFQGYAGQWSSINLDFTKQ